MRFYRAMQNTAMQNTTIAENKAILGELEKPSAVLADGLEPAKILRVK
jgi:hypothetical protein